MYIRTSGGGVVGARDVDGINGKTLPCIDGGALLMGPDDFRQIRPLRGYRNNYCYYRRGRRRGRGRRRRRCRR